MRGFAIISTALIALGVVFAPALARAQTDADADPPVSDLDDASASDAPTTTTPTLRRFHLALGTHGGIADDGTGLGSFFAWGLTFGVAITPHVTVGLTRLALGFGLSSSEGLILSGDFTPYVELGFPASPVIRFFARLGVAMQVIGETNVRPGSFGASVFSSLGSRVFVVPWFSFEMEVALYVPMTDPVRFGGIAVTPATAAGTLGT
jgi:hypothetical protein